MKKLKFGVTSFARIDSKTRHSRDQRVVCGVFNYSKSTKTFQLRLFNYDMSTEHVIVLHAFVFTVANMLLSHDKY